MSRQTMRLHSLTEPLDDGRKRNSGPIIRIESVDSGQQRSRSPSEGRISPGFMRDTNSSHKLLKGAILHNILHPLDYYHERKVRSRSNSCSDDLDRGDDGKMPDIRKARSRPASPTMKNNEDSWPVYKPFGSFRAKKAVTAQMSCPPVPQTVPLISVSPVSHLSPDVAIASSSSINSNSYVNATEFFTHSIKNPIERHKDGHMLEHPRTRRKRTDSNSSSSSSSSSNSSDSSELSSSYYSSSSSETDTEEIPQEVFKEEKHRKLTRSPNVERRSSEPVKRPIEEKRSSQQSKSPYCERRSSGPQEIVGLQPCKSTLSVPIPKQAPRSPASSPSSKFLSIIVSGVNTVKRSSSNLALRRRKKKKKKSKRSKDKLRNEFGPDKHGIGLLNFVTKVPRNEIHEVSSVEKLYSIYDQIIMEDY